MSYSEAFSLAADRTKKTKLIHIIRLVAPDMYCVFMTAAQSELYK
jgi:hypothetical protein